MNKSGYSSAKAFLIAQMQVTKTHEKLKEIMQAMVEK